jgi:hypothetical protein
MTLWLLFYFGVLPWLALLCVLARRSPANERRRTLVAVLFAVSLVVHAFILLWMTVVGFAFAVVWGGGRIAPAAAVFAGLLIACLGHLGVLVSLVRPLGDRWRVASVVALPAGWLLAALVSVATVSHAFS